MDLLQFENDIPQDAKQIRATLQKIITDHHLVFKTNEWWRAHEFPVKEVVTILQKGDLMRLDTVVDETYGCWRCDYLTYGLFSEMLESVDSGLRSFLPSVTKGLVRYAIHQFGSEEQKQKYIPGLADGSLIGCFALTGPPGGSNPQDMEMKARMTPDKKHIALDGSKIWITNGSVADIAIVWASLGARYKKLPEIRAFIVERGEKGFTQQEMKHKGTLCASNTGQLFFENCCLPKEAMLPGTEKGISAAYECLNQARFSIGWGVIGAAKACFAEALTFAGGRSFFNIERDIISQPLKKKQIMQAYFADMGARISSMEARAWRVARLIDEKGGITRNLAEAISFLKWQNVADARQVANTARRILASNAYQIEGTNETYRHYINLDAVETYEGTPEIHQLILGNYFTA
ncbi:MAG: acyl-CoA dehydrogenase [Candidatus Niyogibacteria bacterium CG10_big_fil_rev_8_21_14_0_10_46_36]|uniref:Acyl-CoA dehydrogenase n=1 Tax=Candidatus Niyogibacteria bacterium CG10_big_fil_rev_8_21_14_0_10_46_36 TaxID=1974726 RepID=A0A2H0TDJ3_9BACT|nr:MAG: acyl-CoA dehydrogenase [Candidatus Niyogibacteria bacterium CG10_big_fil_rev_8_21_14_0_10_46_36]